MTGPDQLIMQPVKATFLLIYMLQALLNAVAVLTNDNALSVCYQSLDHNHIHSTLTIT